VANAFTTTYLLESLKRRGMLPTTSETLDAEDFLLTADGEMQSYILPLLLSVREEYLVAEKDISIVSGTASYDIPARAVGSKLREVRILSGSDYVALSRIEPERVETTAASAYPGGYKIQGNKLVLVPTPNTSGTLRVTYFQRPNRLVGTTSVGEITAINTGTGVVTCSDIPTTFTTSLTYDFIKGTPGFDSLNIDKACTAVTTGASGTITFATANLPSDLAVGDFVCLAQESPIPQIPVELHPLLAQRVTAKCLEALGDDKAVLAMQVSEEMRKGALTLLENRVEGAPRIIVNKYGPGYVGRRWY
jgi:hypothetical protein